MKKVAVFAGTNTGNEAIYSEMAHAIGEMAAERGVGLVYGGGRLGLMGALADGSLGAGGYVHGVIPRFLEKIEVAHKEVSKLTITETMHERKSFMYEESDGFLILPGGFGTMEELLEVITHRQLKLHNKPICIFNIDGYWEELLAMFSKSSEIGFIKEAHLGLFVSATSLDGVADFFDEVLA